MRGCTVHSQRTENSERSQIFRVRQALSRTKTIDAWSSNFQPSPLIFLGMGELHHVPEKKTSGSTTKKNSNNGPQVRFETVISM